MTGTRVCQWTDLSTGISPLGWPVPEIPSCCWRRLPEDDDGLIEAACAFYGARTVLAVDGTQCAIQLLPHLRQTRRVAVVSPTYAEHVHAWRQNGHVVDELDADVFDERIDAYDVAIVVNPNNPTGDYRTPDRLRCWHRALRDRGGWLVVDEAFMDTTPHLSLIAEAQDEGLIVLRSFGKFFGCPGVRLGFVAAHTEILHALRERVGPWPVSGAARWIGRLALGDHTWHPSARQFLAQRSHELGDLLEAHGLRPTGSTPLFQWIQSEQAGGVYEHMLARRILVRLFVQPAGLRFGLPDGKKDWERLVLALAELPDGLVQKTRSDPDRRKPGTSDVTAQNGRSAREGAVS